MASPASATCRTQWMLFLQVFPGYGPDDHTDEKYEELYKKLEGLAERVKKEGCVVVAGARFRANTIHRMILDRCLWCPL
jgi:cytosine/adenosine deaminase-related metal-dependent hydrolase